jgi:hypothetical protein
MVSGDFSNDSVGVGSLVLGVSKFSTTGATVSGRMADEETCCAMTPVGRADDREDDRLFIECPEKASSVVRDVVTIVLGNCTGISRIMDSVTDVSAGNII